MEARLVREELEKCHKSEGVNHYENCRWLAEKYAVMLKTAKVCGGAVLAASMLTHREGPRIQGHRRLLMYHLNGISSL